MIFIYIINFINFIICSIFIDKYLHIFQLKDYNFKRYFRFFGKKTAIFLIFNAIFLIFQIFFNNFLFLVISDFVIFFVSISYHLSLIGSQKTPIVYTQRIKRLYIVSAIILFLISLLPFAFTVSYLVFLFIPILANVLNIYDKIANKKFLSQASKKLSLQKTKIIAITGSNGKTSVKNILFEILSLKYKCQKSPKSFNTPLGTARFINQSLNSDTEYLILEYGARRKNDISQLCHFFGADFGIVTSVCPQHLESFKTIENIFRTKQELANFLQYKPCVFNLETLYGLRMFQDKIGKKLGVSISSKSANIFADKIRISDFCTQFNLHFKNTVIPMRTKLLGRHNVLNIMLATALALELGINIEDIKNVVENLEYTPHRLELIKSRINILDDSYNCSLSSAREAVWVMKRLKNKKMVATPGIIEGGKFSPKINFELGQMCSKLDYVIIVGEYNKKDLVQGLQSCNFNSENLFFAKDLEGAKKYFSILNDGDNLLLLNDLPDDYK